MTTQISQPFAGGYEDLRQDFNNTVQTMSNAISEIYENATNIRNEARDISTTADGLSRRTEDTAATLEERGADQAHEATDALVVHRVPLVAQVSGHLTDVKKGRLLELHVYQPQ